MSEPRTQINIRVDRAVLAALGVIMRNDESGDRPPPMSDVVRKLILAEAERIQRKGRK